MVFKLNFLSDCRLTMSQASSILYSPATTCSKKWSKTLLTIQIIWNIGMNQESNLIKIPKAKFFSRPNVQSNVQLRPIAKNAASVISSARLYWTLSWIKSPTWLDTYLKHSTYHTYLGSWGVNESSLFTLFFQKKITFKVIWYNVDQDNSLQKFLIRNRMIKLELLTPEDLGYLPTYFTLHTYLI